MRPVTALCFEVGRASTRLRQFEILACNAEVENCAAPGLGFDSIYVSRRTRSRALPHGLAGSGAGPIFGDLPQVLAPRD